MDTTLDTLAHWRARIFSSLLSFVLVLGAATAIPSIVVAAAQGLWGVVAVDTLALTWVTAVWWCKRWSYTARVMNLLAIIFLVGIGMMVTVGPVSQIYLFSASVLAAVLLGKWPALATLAASALTVFLLGVLGYSRLRVEGLPDNWLTPSIITMNFLFVGTVIAVSSSALLQRLSRSLDDLRLYAGSLRQRQNELQALNAELRLTSAAVAQLNDMLVIARVAASEGGPQPIIFVNAAFEKRTGFHRDEVLGRNWDLLLGADRHSPDAGRVLRAMAGNQAVTAELLHHSRDGQPYWVEMELVPFADEGGRHTHWVAVGRDITERKKSEQHIHHLAYYDSLTGLPNRSLLMERIVQLVDNGQRTGRCGAAIYIDLDHFKYVNDARGHGVGDALLQRAAARLSDMAGKTDTVARIGGDEFVILLAQLGKDPASASAVALAIAEQVRAALTDRFEIDGQHYNSSASVGVALTPRPGQSAHDLLREADTAMYRAKAAGRNRVALFEETMQAEMEQRLTLERDLANALDRGELAMHLQLQVDQYGVPAGAEMLMRWRRADGTMVPPDRFIPVAEECGLIVPMGRWALREACAGLLRLAQEGYTMPLSVNVSPSQFRQPDFVDQVREALEDTGAPASQLIFEVTEGLLIENMDDTIARMHELTAMGIRLSIDDFGTGYSSLAYLKRMPLYELKIDRSFIRDTPADPSGTAIVQSILAMAGHLGLRVVAEGVETREQSAFLAAHGAQGMQGYLFAKPMPLAELIAFLDRQPSQRTHMVRVAYA